MKAYLWTTYAITWMIVGFETIPYKQWDLAKLDCYRMETLKQIQHLPDSTANYIAGALLGVTPLSAQVHVYRNTPTLCNNTIANEDSVSVIQPEDNSQSNHWKTTVFFSRARRLLGKLYSLPNAYLPLVTFPKVGDFYNVGLWEISHIFCPIQLNLGFWVHKKGWQIPSFS